MCLLIGGVQVPAAEISVRCFPSGPNYAYRWKLLDMALARTESGNGAFRLIPFPETLSQARAVRLLESGAIDVIAFPTDPERESRLLPVRIDILRGILGFRILIIRAADQSRIARMDGAALRKQLRFGLNSQWADVAIMRANGYAVTTSIHYENLFAMLAAGRFDAFPRGLNEIWQEFDARKKIYPQLAVEKTKALYYPFPVYFWVKKGNVELARRIEHGLTIMLQDGSFRKLFERCHAKEMEHLRKEKRDVIWLDNPMLPAGAALPDTRWWWPETGKP